MQPIEYIKELAKRYAEEALSDRGERILNLYREHNSKKIVRPPVLVFEVPWGEFAPKEEELQCKCEDNQYHGVESEMRLALFQLKHFGGDYIVHPYYRVHVGLNGTGIGISVKEKIIPSTTGAYIMAHEYEDVLPDYESLEKINNPIYSLNNEYTEKRMEFIGKIFGGIMPYKKAGHSLSFATWDRIPMYHGVDNSLTDLYERSEFIHAMVEKFTQIYESQIDQFEKLNVLDTDPYYIHCTPAPTYDLPAKDMDNEKIVAKDVWIRIMAQIFAVVSPEMHDEFDFRYTKRLFDKCGLSYYGCCEPLDNKIDKLRQFGNLRRISITPWANVESAAEQIGNDYIFSYKPNPAFVASPTFDPEPVIEEVERVIKACLKNNTPIEFVLKDISTISGNYNNLTQWVETVNGVIDRYY
ncbi:MAG: hypothetical protein FWF15_10865 [Oscillospiraceae bacterium]|nr:hypothetical protein [Oscillospiraceae bacterium]